MIMTMIQPVVIVTCMWEHSMPRAGSVMRRRDNGHSRDIVILSSWSGGVGDMTCWLNVRLTVRHSDNSTTQRDRSTTQCSPTVHLSVQLNARSTLNVHLQYTCHYNCPQWVSPTVSQLSASIQWKDHTLSVCVCVEWRVDIMLPCVYQSNVLSSVRDCIVATHFHSFWQHQFTSFNNVFTNICLQQLSSHASSTALQQSTDACM